jgi:hypothetical protein
MRFSLVDLLIAMFFLAIGGVSAEFLLGTFPSRWTRIIAFACAIGLYLAVLAPLYRRFRLFPMILPRCPCCREFQNGFHIAPAWPRVVYRCPTCSGEFVIWHNGQPGDDETWERPVLALKWPYAFGRYQRIEKPTSQEGSVR